jgi:hypothetical protein
MMDLLSVDLATPDGEMVNADVDASNRKQAAFLAFVRIFEFFLTL